MNTPEYEDILASLQDLTHRAYVLGRSEALKKVIEVMQADETPAKPLALAAPSPDRPSPPLPQGALEAPSPVSSAADSVRSKAPVAQDAPIPWWANKPRPIYGAARETTH